MSARYRYTRWRWRVLVHAFDLLGGAAMALWRLFRPKPRVERPERILLIQLDHLGDAVLTTPIIAPLRAAYPQARIDVLASVSNRAVFEADPEVDHVWVAERNWFERRQGAWAMVTAVAGLARLVRGQRYHLGIDVRGDVLAVIVMALAGIPRRVGWSMGGGGFLLTDVGVWRAARHEVESRCALLAALQIRVDAPPRVNLHVSDEDRAAVARWLGGEWPEAHRVPNEDPESLHAGRFGDASPLLAVHLGAGTSAKRWPLGHWRSLVQRFLENGWRVVVVGGPDEASVRLGLPPHHNLRDWTSQTSVPQTTALLERSDLFVGADSGPAHLAAAAAVPSVVLMSGTNRVGQWRPWSRNSLVLRHKVPCQPCHRKVCPLADHPCLSGLRPDRVFRAAMRWWNRCDGFQAIPKRPPGTRNRPKELA